MFLTLELSGFATTWNYKAHQLMHDLFHKQNSKLGLTCLSHHSKVFLQIYANESSAVINYNF